MAISVTPYTRKRIIPFGVTSSYVSSPLNADLIGAINATRCMGFDVGVNGTSGLGEIWTQAWLENLCGCCRAANVSHPTALAATIAPMFRQSTALTFDGTGHVTSPDPASFGILMAEFATGLATANAGQSGANIIEVSHVLFDLEPADSTRADLTAAQKQGLQDWQNEIYDYAKLTWPTAHCIHYGLGTITTQLIYQPGTTTTDVGRWFGTNEYHSFGDPPPLSAQDFDSWNPVLYRVGGAAENTQQTAALDRTKHMRTTFALEKQINPWFLLGANWIIGGSITYWSTSTVPAADLTSLAYNAADFRDDSLIDAVALYPGLYASSVNATAYEAGLSALLTEFHAVAAQPEELVSATAVLRLPGSVTSECTSLDAVTAGEWVYLESGKRSRVRLASNWTSTQADAYGVTLHAASPGQPLMVLKSGSYRPGFTVTRGKEYVLAEEPGGMTTVSNVLSGRFMTRLGVGVDLETIKVGVHVSGKAVP